MAIADTPSSGKPRSRWVDCTKLLEQSTQRTGCKVASLTIVTLIVLAQVNTCTPTPQPLIPSTAYHATGGASLEIPPQLRQLYKHIDQVQEGCADVCNTSITGPDGKFYPQLVKNVDCPALWANKHIDASRVGKAIDLPDFLLDAFSYNGNVVLKKAANSSHGLLDQKYLGNPTPLIWTQQAVNDGVRACATNQLVGTYGRKETNWAFEGLKRMPSVKGGHVLVIGSEQPWLECCALAAGAAKVTTLEYRSITSHHPQLNALTPETMRRLVKSGKAPLFDAVATFSSVEHSGLGRYGDELNPWGDLQTIARSHCVTRPGGGLLVGVMVDRIPTDDGGPPRGRIEWNAHRMYGGLMMSHLTANWIQDWQAPSYQTVYVLHKPDTNSDPLERVPTTQPISLNAEKEGKTEGKKETP